MGSRLRFTFSPCARLFAVRYDGPAPSVASVAANLLLVAASRQVANTHRGPAELPHHLRKAATRSGPSIFLKDLQVVEERLGANSLDAVANFSVNALQAHVPRVNSLSGNRRLRIF